MKNLYDINSNLFKMDKSTKFYYAHFCQTKKPYYSAQKGTGLNRNKTALQRKANARVILLSMKI